MGFKNGGVKSYNMVAVAIWGSFCKLATKISILKLNFSVDEVQLLDIRVHQAEGFNLQ